jgi:hypothetical protein
MRDIHSLEISREFKYTRSVMIVVVRPSSQGGEQRRKSMAITLTRQAVERAHWTAQAAQVVHQHAPTIAQTCAEAPENTIIVAVVEQDCSFGGAWTLPRNHLHERILHLEDQEGKWLLTFSPLASLEGIKRQCASVTRLASKRGAAIERWLDKHAS